MGIRFPLASRWGRLEQPIEEEGGNRQQSESGSRRHDQRNCEHASVEPGGNSADLRIGKPNGQEHRADSNSRAAGRFPRCTARFPNPEIPAQDNQSEPEDSEEATTHGQTTGRKGKAEETALNNQCAASQEGTPRRTGSGDHSSNALSKPDSHVQRPCLTRMQWPPDPDFKD